MNQARLTEIAESMLTKFDAIDGDIASMATNIGDILTDLADVEANVDTIVAKLHTVYYIKSTDTKPIDAVSGDELYYVDTGDYFVYYDDDWHLKVEGNYSPITFILTFDKGAAESVSPESNSVTYDAEYGALATHTYTGYDLGGWFLDTGLTDEITATDIVKIEGDTTVYPEYVPIEYTIKYNLNGGTNNEGNPETYTILDAVTFEDASKDGYTFDSWHDAVTLDSPVTGLIAGSTGDCEVWAKWVADTFDITYTLNGGTNAGANPATYTIETATITLADATKEGYTFDGWFSDAGLTTKVTTIALGSFGDITLYAGWTPIDYDITYELNDGVNGDNPAKYNIETPEITLDAPTKDGYVFDGWYGTADFSGDAVTTIALGSTGAKTLYAKWV